MTLKEVKLTNDLEDIADDLDEIGEDTDTIIKKIHANIKLQNKMILSQNKLLKELKVAKLGIMAIILLWVIDKIVMWGIIKLL